MTDPVTDTPEGSTTGRSGARVLVETAADGSVEVCFANQALGNATSWPRST